MRAVRCEPTVNGVRTLGLIWNGDVIKRIRSHPKHRRRGEILVRIDDNDLGRAFATDPVTGELEPLEPVLTRYMPGTTMHQHELVTRKVKQKREGTHSERSLMEAKRKLRDEALQSLKAAATKSKTRARLARVLGVGAIAPAGDDLGSLDPRRSILAPKKSGPRRAPRPQEPIAAPAPHVAAEVQKRRSGPARKLA